MTMKMVKKSGVVNYYNEVFDKWNSSPDKGRMLELYRRRYCFLTVKDMFKIFD